MSVMSGALERQRTSLMRVALRGIVTGLLAISAMGMPQYFISAIIADENFVSSRGYMAPWIGALVLLSMSIGSAVWLRNCPYSDKQTRTIVTFFAYAGAVMVGVSTIGAASIVRFGSTQNLLGQMDLQFLIVVAGAVTIELFLMFLLYQVCNSLYGLVRS